MSPEGNGLSHIEAQNGLGGNREQGSIHNEGTSNIKDPETGAISGVRRNASDDGLEFYRTQADKWISAMEFPLDC
jgi:hypothetical protein